MVTGVGDDLLALSRKHNRIFAVGHELRGEVPSADAIDVVMAFARWSGVRPLVDVLRRHCERVRAGPNKRGEAVLHARA